MNIGLNTSKVLLLLFTVIIIISCEKFEYSPYQEKVIGQPTNLNGSNIEKILATESQADDTISILFTGDSQRSYNSLDALITKANTLNKLDFLILAGDISDFGLVQEFKWVTGKLKNLNVPYLCVIGNHDLTSNGSQVYENTFGPKNFSFVYKGYKFLFHDTNGREYNFNGSTPNLDWIRSELGDEHANYYIGVSHVPPYDVDFDKALETPYKNLVASQPGYFLSLNGHLHEGGDSYYYDDQVRYITSFSVDKDQCLLLKLIDGRIYKTIIEY